jgi:hypothetical protein
MDDDTDDDDARNTQKSMRTPIQNRPQNFQKRGGKHTTKNNSKKRKFWIPKQQRAMECASFHFVFPAKIVLPLHNLHMLLLLPKFFRVIPDPRTKFKAAMLIQLSSCPAKRLIQPGICPHIPGNSGKIC